MRNQNPARLFLSVKFNFSNTENGKWFRVAFEYSFFLDPSIFVKLLSAWSPPSACPLHISRMRRQPSHFFRCREWQIFLTNGWKNLQQLWKLLAAIRWWVAALGLLRHTTAPKVLKCALLCWGSSREQSKAMLTQSLWLGWAPSGRKGWRDCWHQHCWLTKEHGDAPAADSHLTVSCPQPPITLKYVGSWKYCSVRRLSSCSFTCIFILWPL